MTDDFINKIFQGGSKTAIAEVKFKKDYSYKELKLQVEQYCQKLSQNGITAGKSVILEGDFSFHSIALLLALIKLKVIVTPVLKSLPQDEKEHFYHTSEASFKLFVDKQVHIEQLSYKIKHTILKKLADEKRGAFIIYTSGTTGLPKGAVHDAKRLLARFQKKRPPFVTLASLLFDHIGGLDVLFTTMASHGSLIIPTSFDPGDICSAIHQYKVELFPATATLLRMILVSEAYKNLDLSSVQVIAYGSETMPEHLLKKLHEIFPKARFKQTFGMTETGTLSTISRDSDSLYIKFVGNANVKVENGKLYIKTPHSMLGYLNAPNPIDENGWLDTGDAVEVKGEWLRILGRKSDLINVGGQKVYPSEVESIISMLPFIKDVTVFGEKNALLGNIVTAKVTLSYPMDATEVRNNIRNHCKQHLANYKVPQKIEIVAQTDYNYRLKKLRRNSS